MATAHAKATGKIGVCLATSGPGGIHLLNGLYDAQLDHMPVLAITACRKRRNTRHRLPARSRARQAVPGRGRVRPHDLQPGPAPCHRRHRHPRTAYARRGVAHIAVPNDIQVADADADPWQHVAPAAAPKTAAVYLSPPGLAVRPGQPAAAGRFPQRWQQDRHPGRSRRLHAREELLILAETLAAPIVKTLPGKATVPTIRRTPPAGSGCSAPQNGGRAGSADADGHQAGVVFGVGDGVREYLVGLLGGGHLPGAKRRDELLEHVNDRIAAPLDERLVGEQQHGVARTQ